MSKQQPPKLYTQEDIDSLWKLINQKDEEMRKLRREQWNTKVLSPSTTVVDKCYALCRCERIAIKQDLSNTVGVRFVEMAEEYKRSLTDKDHAKIVGRIKWRIMEDWNKNHKDEYIEELKRSCEAEFEKEKTELRCDLEDQKMDIELEYHTSIYKKLEEKAEKELRAIMETDPHKPLDRIKRALREEIRKEEREKIDVELDQMRAPINLVYKDGKWIVL